MLFYVIIITVDLSFSMFQISKIKVEHQNSMKPFNFMIVYVCQIALTSVVMFLLSRKELVDSLLCVRSSSSNSRNTTI